MHYHYVDLGAGRLGADLDHYEAVSHANKPWEDLGEEAAGGVGWPEEDAEDALVEGGINKVWEEVHSEGLIGGDPLGDLAPAEQAFAQRLGALVVAQIWSLLQTAGVTSSPMLPDGVSGIQRTPPLRSHGLYSRSARPSTVPTGVGGRDEWTTEDSWNHIVAAEEAHGVARARNINGEYCYPYGQTGTTRSFLGSH